MPTPDKLEYLGDSVYVRDDGFHVWLETRNGLPTDPSNAIALDPHVLRAFVKYIERLQRAER